MFSQTLRLLRKEKKLSQAALAQNLGISQQAVGKWEQGVSTPDPSTLDRLADLLDVSVDMLLGRASIATAVGTQPTLQTSDSEVCVPIIGRVKAGYDAVAFQEFYGMESANVRNPENYFYLIVHGDSMEPRISAGDLALVRKQPSVESGELAVVLIDGDEGTLKRLLKKDGAVILQAFNQAYETQIFIGEEIERLTVVGKVVETKAKW